MDTEFIRIVSTHIFVLGIRACVCMCFVAFGSQSARDSCMFACLLNEYLLIISVPILISSNNN